MEKNIFSALRALTVILNKFPDNERIYAGVRSLQQTVSQELSKFYDSNATLPLPYHVLASAEREAITVQKNKIHAIKLYRERTGLDLRTAKDFIEAQILSNGYGSTDSRGYVYIFGSSGDPANAD